MTDIVERLRVTRVAVAGYATVEETVLNEAIAEIERLRAENRTLRNLGVDVGATIEAAVATERAAILELIESACAKARLYDGNYALRTVTAAIRARGEHS